MPRIQWQRSVRFRSSSCERAARGDDGSPPFGGGRPEWRSAVATENATGAQPLGSGKRATWEARRRSADLRPRPLAVGAPTSDDETPVPHLHPPPPAAASVCFAPRASSRAHSRKEPLTAIDAVGGLRGAHLEADAVFMPGAVFPGFPVI